MADLAGAIEAKDKASARLVEVTTRHAGRQYRARITDGNDRLIATYHLAMADEDMVWIYTAEHSVGLYKLDRFGGALAPSSIRHFFLSVS